MAVQAHHAPFRPSRLLRHQAEFAGAGDGLKAARGVELAVDVAQVRLDRLLADDEFGCDAAVGGAVDLVQVVIHPDDHDLYDAAAAGASPKVLPPVHGGATRQQSCLAGLEALSPHGVSRVLLHDAARPFVTPDIIDRVLEGIDVP